MITSPRNARVVAAARLARTKVRRDEGRTLLEGPNLLAAAVAAGAAIETVFVVSLDDAAAVPSAVEVLEVTPGVLERLAPTEHPRGPVAVMAIPPDGPPSGGDALVLWGVSDPGNVGTLIRTAAAFGLDAIIGPGCADPWSPKALRAGAGGHFGTTVAAVAGTADLVGRGLAPVATVVDGGGDPAALPPTPVAVIIGSEAHGLPPDVVAACSLSVTIPMPGGAESLNAAAAGAILAYAISRRPR